MKKQTLLSGCIFIGFGIYFLLQHYHVMFLSELYTWPSLLLIVGIGFLLQAYVGKDYDAILPGVVITGIGVHFHLIHHLDIWPDHTGIFLLVLALGLLLSYVKTGKGLIQGGLFLIAAVFILFFDSLTNWAAERGHNLSFITSIWPYLFIVIGAYFIFFHRKR
ncbi:DUF5668 domain-containing protein [Bacillus sp. FJAT-50079]|uniref:LiaI-LiaF-like domain-containing protein n=1 Tax=Bacillus sp. FJAT-50079 TaxID=2833577 RepID=UPI001BC91FFF|nr:hypothetical protein [Bacillus sp. FJAT-50079]